MPLVNKTFDQLLDFTRTTSGTFVGSDGLIQTTPASVNLLLWTQQFDNAGWGVGATTVTANSAVAPDGTSTADKVIATAVAGYHVKNQLTTVTSGVSYTLSFYVKAAEYTKVYFCDAQSGRYACSFDLAAVTAGTPTGSYGNKSASITDAGNGWYRCELQFIPNATEASRPSATGYPDTGATLTNFGASYTGDGTSGVYVWGAQLEAVPDANLVLGSTVVTNGDFASATGWTPGTGWAVASGEATFTANGTNSPLYNAATSSSTAGKTYRVEYTVVANTLNASALRVGGFTGSSFFNATTTLPAVVGVNVVYIYVTAPSGAGNTLDFWVSGAATSGAITLDNISVKEITGTVGMPSTYTRNNGGVYPPRFDYDPVTLAAKGLLIEEQRTNLFTYSEQFDNAAWTKANATITANTTASPDGTTNADKLVEDTATSVHTVATGSITATANNFYTFTIYAKASGRDFIQINFSNVTLSGNVWDVDLAANTITFVSAGAGWSNVAGSITNVGNGWRRISVSGQVGATISAVVVTVRLASSPSTIVYTGDGTSGAFIYGAQLEAGAFATSYIPTVASQVTRTADICTIVAPNFAPWYNQAAGTFVVEFTPDEGLVSNVTRVLTVSQAGAAARVVDISYVGTNWTTYNGAVITAIGAASVTSTPQKIAVAYAASNYGYVLNGGTVATDTSALVNSPTQMAIGNTVNVNQLNGHIRSVRYYPTRLSNAQIQALTA